MSTPLLTTKLYIPPPRPNLVPRPRLIERLNGGLSRRLTLVAAPVGFGKTTLLGAWIAQSQPRVAWMSLDESDNVSLSHPPSLMLTWNPLTEKTDALGCPNCRRPTFELRVSRHGALHCPECNPGLPKVRL